MRFAPLSFFSEKVLPRLTATFSLCVDDSPVIWEDEAEEPFEFLKPGDLAEGDLRLVLLETARGTATRAPAYRFEMRRVADSAKIGRIELRIGDSHDLLMYTGHIGYHVEPKHRGKHYAARGCTLLLELARRHGQSEIWITCDPDNGPSFRTCELAGGTFEGVVQVPRNHIFYKSGSKKKCRFRVMVS